IVDSQLINLFQTKGFLCIPVLDNNGLICVLAAGFNNSLKEQTHLKQFLSFFAHEAASVCRTSLKNIANQESVETKKDLLLHNDHIDMRLEEVIHEANNQLSIISNYLYSLSQKLDTNEPFSSDDISKELSIVREE